MQIGILGTGGVAQTLGRRWSAAGHRITFGSRDPASKAALDGPVTTLAAAVADSDVVVNATPGSDRARWPERSLSTSLTPPLRRSTWSTQPQVSERRCRQPYPKQRLSRR